MSIQQTLNQFFTKKIFVVPKYQRSYAWDTNNIRELYEDIQEALDTQSSHYIGTVVLARTSKKDVYHVVDGQQRLTTVTMFISSLINKLKDKTDKEYYKRLYIKNREDFKFTPLVRDSEFFHKLLSGHKLIPQNKSQRNLIDAYEAIENITEVNIEDHLEFLKTIEDLYTLEFIEEKDGDAIRIFQTVNDRGKELSRLDKIKSLLFYFSNKYLGEKLDDVINDTFGDIFEYYDDIKQIATARNINTISSSVFSEDDLMRHHHICFSEESYDPTSQQVMDNIKSSLLIYRKSKDYEGLEGYINKYIKSLSDYVRAFKTIIDKTTTDEIYYKLFSILGLSVVYYPVITQMEKMGILDKQLHSKPITVIEMIEIIDVRVLKIREYAGRKHIADFAYNLNNSKVTFKDIESHLLWFNNFEISDDRFKDFLTDNDYFKQTGLLRLLFIDYCERLKNKKYTLVELEATMKSEPTIEHILSQTPKFKPKSFGFRNEEDFEDNKNIIGNLTILEKKINSSIKNDDLVNKITGYDKSKFIVTKRLATKLSKDKVFKKDNLKERTKSIVEDFAMRWWAK